MVRYITVPFFLILAVAACWAVQPYEPVQPDPFLEPWRWQFFDELNGLGLQCLAEDRDGNMWFGTDAGARRYDGTTWTAYTPEDGLHGAPVITLHAGRDGSVYAGTAQGISRFKDGTWQRIFPPEGDMAWTINGLLQTSDNSLWAATQRGPLQVKGETFTLFCPEKTQPALADSAAYLRFVTIPETALPPEGGFPAFDVFEDREGAMWFSCNAVATGRHGEILRRGGEILRYDLQKARANDPDAWRLYTEADGLDSGSGARIIQTRDGIIWSAANWSASGVNRFDGAAWSHINLRDLGGTSINADILETRDGAVWVSGFGGSPLHVFRDGRWHIYGPDVRSVQSRPYPWHRARLLEASDGALWIAGLGQGAVRVDLNASRWQSYEGLRYQGETSDGARWFTSRDSSVVRSDGRTWVRYGVEDGLMDSPHSLTITRNNVVWAAGSHENIAATARFDGNQWQLKQHPRLARTIFPASSYEASDGSLWFSAHPGPTSEGQLRGLLRFDGETWTHYAPPEAPPAAYGIAQTPDGTLWFTGGYLSSFDGQTWTPVTEPQELTVPFSHRAYVTREGDLWVGTRTYGIFRYNGRTWTRYDMQDGLVDNSAVYTLSQAADGSLWAGTIFGTSRFDGKTWTNMPHFGILVDLHQSRDGALWMSLPGRVGDTREGPHPLVIRYQPDTVPPETDITLFADEVSQPGNTTLSWTGADPWRLTPDTDLQFAYRLDNGEWSAFSKTTYKTLLTLPGGPHTFEVKARDRDFNEDPTPASVTFTVVPPVWQQPWFLGMVVLFLGVIGLQASRIVINNRKLRESNFALSTANKDLFGVNRNLQQDRAVERVRAEITAMKSAEDLPEVVGGMLKELSEAGVDFDLCVINIVDGEAEVRRQYGATKAGWSGQAEMPLSEVSEAFMAIYKGEKPVVRQADDALAEACLHTRQRLGLTEPLERPTAVVDAPFAYGTLSLQTSGPEGFSDEGVALLGEFARVIALGYARFLDFQLLEAQNRELQRERAVEHIRGQVQAMEQASDFEVALSVLVEDLKAVGLSFDTCGIDVLDDPVEDPTMAYFETHGFRYTTYTIDPEGRVTDRPYHIQAPFPEVIQATIERFLEGRSWQGSSEETTILEVPASRYGRLRITASEQERYTQEDVDALQDFASAIALGYARYLDFREIQEQTERKSRFLASMSHELRTPMNAIIGFTRMVLRREKNISERNRENLTKVRISADHLLELINGILDLSKIESGQTDVNVERFDVKELVASCCAEVEPLVEARPGLKLDYSVPEDVGEAHTDRGRLRQIVINLLSNAIKFTHQGEVAVRVSKDGQAGEEPSLVLAVSDTGTGIPADALESIFEEFQQVKGSDPQHKGTGLGLPITKGFAELLGGTIGVQSEVGKGSTFTVRIPLVYSLTETG